MNLIDRAMATRISRSPLSITLVFPPPPPVFLAVAPTTLPASPLTGPATNNVVVQPSDAESAPRKTFKCLWMDIATGSELTDRTTEEEIKFRQLGWVAEATALARVLVSDAALDADNPYGGTHFDKVSYILYHGQKYRVLQVVPFGSGSRLPITYHIWLVGTK